jgi:hypothetical protein
MDDDGEQTELTINDSSIARDQSKKTEAGLSVPH